MTTSALAAVAAAAAGATAPAALTPPAPDAVARADHDRAVAAATAAGIAAERARIAAILDHAEAEGRAAAARQLAFKTEMSVDASGDFLKGLPKAEATPGALAQLEATAPTVTLGSGAKLQPADEVRAGWKAAAATINKRNP